MKKYAITILVLLLSVSLAAQQRTGNMYGKVKDTEGTPLPGATVTLSAPILAPITTTTSREGFFRFQSLSPGRDYTLTSELAGFKKATKTSIIVTLGSNVEINLAMEIGKLEEEVTVVAVSPIVDTKKTAVGLNVDHNSLQSLPTARDPWVVMQLAPSVMLDRENVGGNESGQQASFLAKGDMANSGYFGSNNIFAIDGIDITDPAALGGSAIYYDFDMFEELNITTGGAADVSIQTGGINLNMVTRRGGNKSFLEGRFYLTDNFFQANNLTADLKSKGVANINKIQQIKDYGFNAGGPILKDKVWWWAAYGVQDIFNWTMYATQDKTLLNNYNAKVNAQLYAGNRFEAQVTAGAKEKFGRDANVAQPEGNHQTGKYHWGSPIVKILDEQTFGNNFYISLRYSFNDAGFKWYPMIDESMQYPVVYDQTSKSYSAALYGGRSWSWYYASRPRNNAQFTSSYFNDNLFGLSHEIKFGAEYSHKHAEHHWGNGRDFDININYPSAQIDLNADGVREIPTGWRRISYYREGMDNNDVQQIAGYAQDTITKGNFTLLLGLRYDYQRPYAGAYTIPTVGGTAAVVGANAAWNTVFDSSAQTTLSSLLPSISVNEIKPDYRWNTFSPRLGLTWNITGDGKTVAKIALSQYGDVLGTGFGLTPPLGLMGTIDFWWNDLDSDKKVTLNELYWLRSSTHALKYQPYAVFSGSSFVGDGTASPWADGRLGGMWSGFDPAHPTTVDYTTTTNFYDDKAKASSRIREFLVTLEREILPDFDTSINFTYRRYDKFGMWIYDYDAATNQLINSSSWYMQAGTIPATVGGISTGDAAGKPWYVLKTGVVPTDNSYITKSDQYNTYWGLDFVVNKRLSNKWFMNASFTLQDQRAHNWASGNPDPTNKWAFDEKPYALAGGGTSGKTYINMYSRWLLKFSGLYQLPWDVNISGTFLAREGWRIPHYFYIIDTSLNSNFQDNWIYLQEISKDALPTFYNLTFRIEKMIKIGQGGRLYLMADCFNVLNSDIVNRAYDAYLGDYDVAAGTFAPDATNRRLNEILNPRVTRFGARFSF